MVFHGGHGRVGIVAFKGAQDADVILKTARHRALGDQHETAEFETERIELLQEIGEHGIAACPIDDVMKRGVRNLEADRAMGGAAHYNDPAIKQATVQLNFDFIDAAQIGNIVEIDCEVMRRTGSIVFEGRA